MNGDVSSIHFFMTIAIIKIITLLSFKIVIYRVQINFSKLYCEKFLQNFKSFSFAQMSIVVVPEGQKESKFCMLLIAGKFIFQCKLRYLVRANKQSDF